MICKNIFIKRGKKSSTMDIGNNLKVDPIIELNQEAMKRQADGEKVVNGTIGMMHLDDGSLPIPSSIRDAFKSHTEDNDFEYSSVAGVSLYRKLLLHWFFQDSLDQAMAFHQIETIATPGGTGALILSFKDFASYTKPIVLLPKLGWPNYPNEVSSFIHAVDFYNNYNKEGTLDIEDIKEKIDSSFSQGYENILLLLNDPCENPTGYSLSEEEREALLELVNSYPGNVHVLLDIAYIDYSDEKTKESLVRFLLRLKTLTYICMSFSKTFSFYGLRVGALSLYSPKEREVELHFESCLHAARGLWSTINHQAMNVIVDLLSDEDHLRDLHQEVDNNRSIIEKRAFLFLEEAKDCGLEVYPYKFGFYISIPCKDAFETCNKLKEKGIFLSPVTTKVLRAAICCIPTPDIPGLARAIKEAQ